MDDEVTSVLPFSECPVDEKAAAAAEAGRKYNLYYFYGFRRYINNERRSIYELG